MGLTARQEAARQLQQDAERGSFSGHSRRGIGGDAADERQITDLVAGVIRWQRYLDFLIEALYTGDAVHLEPKVRTVLRLGLLELVITDTPSHAAVHETVELAKLHAHPRAAGLVNGILRSVGRLAALPEPNTGDRVTDLAIRHSHPDWMVKRWMERWTEEEVVTLLEYNNSRPHFGIHNIGLTDEDFDALGEEGVSWTRSTVLPDFIRVTSVQPLIRGGAIRDGRARVQDEAAGLVVRAMAPEPGQTILDVCAAPGGKAVYAAHIMQDKGRVLAADVHRNRTRLIKRSVASMGLTCVETRVVDGRTPHTDMLEVFDAVLVDAPCSGLGVLSKRADMRWNRKESDIRELGILQTELLDGAARCVRPGGLLVYSTCTTEPDENETQIRAFLRRNKDWQREDVPEGVPRDARGAYVSLPQHTGFDGAYAVRLRRPG